MSATSVQILAAILFALAILHTFSTQIFERLAHKRPAHAGLFHLLGEVEVVFGFWALVLMIGIILLEGAHSAVTYMNSRNFTEVMFVFAIMVVAASRPVLHAASALVRLIGKILPLPRSVGVFFTLLALVPLLGSFITEPAAMTLAALMLKEHYFSKNISSKLKYAALGVLFVNVSIGGTLTSFAAPPILMVAHAWNWDSSFVIRTFGWKAAVAVLINASVLSALFFKELRALSAPKPQPASMRIPLALTLAHLFFLTAVVVCAHYPPIFMGLFLFFLGVAHAYERHQDRLILREGLLVAFFLAGLVVLGGLQQWWLKPLLMSMSSTTVFFGATGLTAVTDNAALTYLGSLVEGLSDEFKYALVTGAVTGGGLTVIANAPNPAGMSILRDCFSEGTVKPVNLFLAAALPTCVAMAAFLLL